MEKLQITYTFRVKPYILSWVDTINAIQVEGEYAEKYNQQISLSPQNPSNLYFLNNAQDLYISNLIVNLLFLSVTKAVEALLFCLKTKFPILRKLYHWLRKNNRPWTLLTMTIEANLIVIVFNCGLQLLVPMHFNFYNKLNFAVCLIFLFAGVAYAAAFYQMVYAFEKRRAAESILNYSEYSAKSFFLESCCFHLRTVARGALQSLTFQNYQIQIISLTVTDVVFCFAALIFRDGFCHKVVFLCVFLYNFFFFVLDTVLIVHLKYRELFSTVQYEVILEVIIFCIIGVNFALFIFLFVLKVYETYSESKEKPTIV
jgi:hypothetical protein